MGGLLIWLVAFGGLYSRTANEPGVERRVNWALGKVGVCQETPRGKRSTAPRTRAETVSDRRHNHKQDDQLELFKLGLNLPNIVVGLIGIYLAASSMRSWRVA